MSSSSTPRWWRRSATSASPESADATADAGAASWFEIIHGSEEPQVAVPIPVSAPVDEPIETVANEEAPELAASNQALPLPEIATRDDLDDTTKAGEHATMSSLDEALQQLLAIEGASGAAIVDYSSGMALAQGGNPAFDLGVAAAGNSNVVRAKLATMRDLGVTDQIDDILITLDSQYHLINVLNTSGTNGLFIYLVLNRSSANLALARHKLKGVAASISV